MEMFHKRNNVGLTKEKHQREKCRAGATDQTILQGIRFRHGTLQGNSAGSLLRRVDLIKVVFLWVCLSHICPATSCGVDPMRHVENYARIKGFDTVDPVLNYMRLNTPLDYYTLMKEKEDFIACIRMVHTGYFKRSMEIPVNTQQPLPQRLPNTLPMQQNENKLSQILVDRNNFNQQPLLEPGLGTQFLNFKEMEQTGLQLPPTAYESQARSSFLQRLKSIGQESPVSLQSYDNFADGEFYNGITKKRR